MYNAVGNNMHAAIFGENELHCHSPRPIEQGHRQAASGAQEVFWIEALPLETDWTTSTQP